ncbi:hypothetical protein Tco_0071882 [Tanacetum coccineum]
MQVSAFMSNSKCPELARRFSDQVPKTVTEMMKKVDDFLKSEEAYKSTELPKGEFPDKGQRTSYRGNRPPRAAYGGGQQRTDNHNTFNRKDHSLTVCLPEQEQRYDNRSRKFTIFIRDALPSDLSVLVRNSTSTAVDDLKPKRKHDRYLDYHGEKGHCTNDCYQLKRQLEAALEFEKLNHLIKDIRQSLNDDEVHSSKSIIPTQYNLRTHQNERAQGCLIHRSCYDKVSYPKGNCYFGHPSNLSFRMPKEKKQAKQERNTEEVKPGRQGELAEEEILINPAFPEQKVTIGTQFSKECRFQLINLLKSNMDVFAWQPSDMTGFPKRIMKHTLNVNLSIPPVEKKRRVLGTEKSRAVDVSLCVDTTYRSLLDMAYWTLFFVVSCEVQAQIRRIFLDGYGVLDVRIVFFRFLRLSFRMRAF